MPRFKITGTVLYIFTVFVNAASSDDAMDRCDPSDGELEEVDGHDVEEIRPVEA